MKDLSGRKHKTEKETGSERHKKLQLRPNMHKPRPLTGKWVELG